MEKEKPSSNCGSLSKLDSALISDLWEKFKIEFKDEYSKMTEFCGRKDSPNDINRAGLLEDKIFWFVVMKIDIGEMQLPHDQMRDFFAGNVRFDIMKHAYSSEEKFLFKNT